MSVLDRARRIQTSQEDTQSSSLAPVDSPAVHRMRLVFNEVFKRAEGQGRAAWIIKSIADEVMEEIAGQGLGVEISEYLLLTSRLIRWVATGETDDLPEEFEQHVLQLDAPQALALPAGDAMNAHK